MCSACGHVWERHPTYVDRLIGASAGDTVYTDVFSMNWANAPRRVLRSCIAAAAAFERKVVGETPDLFEVRDVARRFDCLAVTRDTLGQIEAMSRWAGESVGAVNRAQLAADIVREVVEEATAVLHLGVGLAAASEQST